MIFKQVVVVRTDLKMGKGKIAAQCAHASISSMEKTMQKNNEWVSGWKATGQQKVVLKIGSKEELVELFEQVKNILPSALIKDAGHTQVEPGETTCLGIGPAPGEQVDKFTGKLKLL